MCIRDRCRRLSLSTAVNDIYRFDLLKEFLNEKCTSCSSITDKKWEELERSYKAFLYKKGLALYVRRNRPDRRNVEQQSSAQISFLKMYYAVSYTHLDVYKRQAQSSARFQHPENAVLLK